MGNRKRDTETRTRLQEKRHTAARNIAPGGRNCIDRPNTRINYKYYYHGKQKPNTQKNDAGSVTPGFRSLTSTGREEMPNTAKDMPTQEKLYEYVEWNQGDPFHRRPIEVKQGSRRISRIRNHIRIERKGGYNKAETWAFRKHK